MIAKVLLRLRLAFAKSPTRIRQRGRNRRRSARFSLACGVLAFIGATAGLTAAFETVRPEWRDPEFGHRFNQIRSWQARAPHRPLILVAGSSHTQMGIVPAAMDLPDEPGSPLVYNLGYRASPPAASGMHIFRVIDSGIKPAGVLFEFCPSSLMAGAKAIHLPGRWPGRLSFADVKRLRELGATNDPYRNWTKNVWYATFSPWTSCRLTLMSHWLPAWVPEDRRINLRTEHIDEYGTRPCPCPTPTPEFRQASLEHTKESCAKLFVRTEIEPATDQALGAIVARCRSLDIPIAFYRVPESPMFRSWFTPESIAAGDAYAAELSRKFGVEVFPAPDDIQETDFVDGHHLIPTGAARYSKWLADTHIKPWFARMRKQP